MHTTPSDRRALSAALCGLLTSMVAQRTSGRVSRLVGQTAGAVAPSTDGVGGDPVPGGAVVGGSGRRYADYPAWPRKMSARYPSTALPTSAPFGRAAVERPRFATCSKERRDPPPWGHAAWKARYIATVAPLSPFLDADPAPRQSQFDLLTVAWAAMNSS